MKIDDGLVDRLEKLSMLKIKDKEKQAIKENLQQIIEFVDILGTIDISKAKTLTNTLDNTSRLREDMPKVNKQIAQDILKNAPKAQDGYFITPKII